MLASGGEVWFGDETTLREFPPLRASWAKRGQQREVVISGRNGRRVIHGALNAHSGELVKLGRERSRQAARTTASPSSSASALCAPTCPNC